MLCHGGIGNRQRSHGLDNGRGPGHDARVMATLGGEDALASGVVAGGPG